MGVWSSAWPDIPMNLVGVYRFGKAIHIQDSGTSNFPLLLITRGGEVEFNLAISRTVKRNLETDFIFTLISC